MTTGVLTTSAAVNYSVTSAACMDVVNSMNATFETAGDKLFVYGCTTDPVITGTLLNYISNKGVLSTVAVSTITAQSDTFDYVTASSMFSIGFGTVLVLYFSSKGIGEVLKMFKR